MLSRQIVFISINKLIDLKGLNMVILLFIEVEGSCKSPFSLIRINYSGPVMYWALCLQRK